MVAEIELTNLRNKLTEFFNKVKLTGTAEITPNEDGSYTIKIGTYTFSGFSPEGYDSIFTLQLLNTTKILPTDLEVDYIEAIIFSKNDFVPLEFLIHQYPQTQTYFINNGTYKKGTIYYENFCPCTGCISAMKFEKPVFESEIISFEHLKEV